MRKLPARGRPRRRHLPALCAWGLALTQVFAGAGCSSDSIGGKGGGSSSTVAGVLAANDLGAAMFSLVREQVAREPDLAVRDARLAALDARRDDFVGAVNDVLNASTLQGAGPTTDAVLALVDDGTLPTLFGHVANALDELASDPQATAALARWTGVQRAAATLPPAEAIALLGRLFNYPETEQTWRAVATLIAENDGRDDQGRPNGEPTLVPDLHALLHELAVDLATPSARPQGPDLSRLLEVMAQAVTEEAVLRGNPDLGPAEWVARLDPRGLPRVARDPATGRLPAPFVDHDGDRLADVDALDRFVDAAGAPLDRPAFGRAGSPGYDAEGRATTDAGAPLFEVVDAKRTAVALGMKLAGELLARDLHHDGRVVLEAALGPQRADGTYAPDGPAIDLLAGVLSLLEPDAAMAVLRGVAALLRQDPARGEALFVALARARDAAHGATPVGGGLGRVRLSDPRLVQLVDDLMPLLDDVFEQPAATSSSTALVLLDAFVALRAQAPDFAHQLAPLFVYRSVERELAPDGDRNGIDEARSRRVDYAQPATAGGAGENRSAAHQLLDLLARADGCQLLGKSLAVWVLDLMAGLSPQTVGSLASMVQALPGFLTNLFCSGISGDIQALDALAKAGALDGFLPLAKAFKDRGETELLVRLLVRVQRDWSSTLRAVEPDLAAVLEAGALDALQDVAAQARAVQDPATGEPVANAVARALAGLVDTDAATVDHRGRAAPSRAHLLLRPLQALDARLAQAGAGPAFDRLLDGGFDVLLAREQVNGQELLRNGSFVPLTATLLDALLQVLPADAATRASDVRAVQARLDQALASRHTATVVAVLRTIHDAPSKALIDRGLVSLLTPSPTRERDVFGGLARLAVQLLALPPGALPLADLAPAVARILDPRSPLVPEAIVAFERLLTADGGKTILTVLRAATNPAPGEPLAPAGVLLEIAQEVWTAGAPGAAPGAAPLAPDDVRDFLRWGAAFIRDDQSGLESFFALIRARQR